MYCKNCGAQLDDRAVICPHCGATTDNYYRNEGGANNVQQPAPSAPVNDAKSAGYAVLCFFIPILGLILYLVWKDTYPLRASSCGKGAIAGVVVEVVLGILYGILLAAAANIIYSAALSALL